MQPAAHGYVADYWIETLQFCVCVLNNMPLQGIFICCSYILYNYCYTCWYEGAKQKPKNIVFPLLQNIIVYTASSPAGPGTLIKLARLKLHKIKLIATRFTSVFTSNGRTWNEEPSYKIFVPISGHLICSSAGVKPRRLASLVMIKWIIHLNTFMWQFVVSLIL